MSLVLVLKLRMALALTLATALIVSLVDPVPGRVVALEQIPASAQAAR